MQGEDGRDYALFEQKSNMNDCRSVVVRVSQHKYTAHNSADSQLSLSRDREEREERRGQYRMYSEVSLPGKGCGVVASRDISPGELIIAESPLIRLPWWIRHSLFPGNPPGWVSQ